MGLIDTSSIKGVGAASSLTRLAAPLPHLTSGMCVDLDLERPPRCVDTRPEHTPVSFGCSSPRPIDLERPRSWLPLHCKCLQGFIGTLQGNRVTGIIDL